MNAFNRLIRSNTKSPIVLSVSFRGSSLLKEVTFVFVKLNEVRQKVECAKCEVKSEGARFEAKITGGAQRGGLRFIDLCLDCCVQYGWTDSRLDEVLEAKLMGQRSW